MRKLLSVLTGLVIVSTSATSVVSCDQNYYDGIWVITDGGTINDKAFNESAWDGGNMYIRGDKNGDDSSRGLGLKSMSTSYYEASGARISDFKMAYDSAVIDGARTLILPGFKHGNTLNVASQLAKSVIYIDGSNPINNTSHRIPANKNKTFDNVVALSYASESSGFYAALAAAAYEVGHGFTDNGSPNGKYVMMTFGGMENAGAVDTYMIGFYLGMAAWNYNVTNFSKATNVNDGKKDPMNWIKSLKGMSKLMGYKGDKLPLLHIGSSQKGSANETLDANGKLNLSDDSLKFFSGSFDPGKGQHIAQQCTGDGAHIIMAVAGPQTKDAIDVLKDKYHDKGKTVGVDTDQAASYNTPGHDGVITSALKNIKQSVHDALNNIDNQGGSWLGTTQSSAEGPNTRWNGIAYAGGAGGYDASNAITSDVNDYMQKTGYADADSIEFFVNNHLIPWYTNEIINHEKANWTTVTAAVNKDDIKTISQYKAKVTL